MKKRVIHNWINLIGKPFSPGSRFYLSVKFGSNEVDLEFDRKRENWFGGRELREVRLQLGLECGLKRTTWTTNHKTIIGSDRW